MDASRAECAGCGRPMAITRVECRDCGVVTEGEFDVAPLARLSERDQTFVHAFVRAHGSIVKMERILGVSYPTVKNRLNAITDRLDESYRDPAPRSRVLEQLANGEITVDQALERLAR